MLIPVFSGTKKVVRSPPICTILEDSIFQNVIWTDEPFAKALRSLKFSVLVNTSLCKKLVSSLESPTTYDERFKVASVPFYIPI